MKGSWSTMKPEIRILSEYEVVKESEWFHWNQSLSSCPTYSMFRNHSDFFEKLHTHSTFIHSRFRQFLGFAIGHSPIKHHLMRLLTLPPTSPLKLGLGWREQAVNHPFMHSLLPCSPLKKKWDPSLRFHWRTTPPQPVHFASLKNIFFNFSHQKINLFNDKVRTCFYISKSSFEFSTNFHHYSFFQIQGFIIGQSPFKYSTHASYIIIIIIIHPRLPETWVRLTGRSR